MAKNLELDAYILDLDGVVTRTAVLHETAWKRLFDEYRERRLARGQAGYPPFTHDDYLEFVDGRPRDDGTRAFFESRGIRLPKEELMSLGDEKNAFFRTELEKKGPEVFDDAVEALRAWRGAGFRTAIASSSKNCEEILGRAGLLGLFDARVDGRDLEDRGIPGKPAPDMFLEAARLLGVAPARAAVLEDAIAGVQAGRAGGFGLVVGVARFGHPERLSQAGADVVVAKLTELLPQRLRKPA